MNQSILHIYCYLKEDSSKIKKIVQTLSFDYSLITIESNDKLGQIVTNNQMSFLFIESAFCSHQNLGKVKAPWESGTLLITVLGENGALASFSENDQKLIYDLVDPDAPQLRCAGATPAP